MIYFIKVDDGFVAEAAGFPPYKTTNQNFAKRFTSQEKAVNYAKNNAKTLLAKSKSYRIEKMECSYSLKEEKNIENSGEENGFSFHSNISIEARNMCDAMTNFASAIKAFNEVEQEGMNKLSEIEKSILDILHYIEFSNFSASDGYKLCKLLKQLRIERRNIKDNMEISKIMRSTNMDLIRNGNTEDAINGLTSRKYAPRVMKKLFQDGIRNYKFNQR